MKLSEHFSLGEFTESDYATRHGIKNEPSPEIIQHIKAAAEGMEKVRTLLGDKPITITSGYRNPEVNKGIGSSSRSDHPTGFCVDFKCWGYGAPKDIVSTIFKSDLKYDQLIEEGNWTHISFHPKMRRQTLIANFNSRGKASYTFLA